jgi:hypothetical protein
MSVKWIFLLCLPLLLQACATLSFTPVEYPLRDGLIPPMDVAGNVSVRNAQPSSDPQIVMSGSGIKYQSDYHTVTEVMVQQTNKELLKASRPAAGSAKSIALRVTYLQSEYVAFFYNSKISFDATLGDGTVLNMTVPHSSGNPVQDVDGCIAEGVMKLLNDPQLRAYLAK